MFLSPDFKTAIIAFIIILPLLLNSFFISFDLTFHPLLNNALKEVHPQRNAVIIRSFSCHSRFCIFRVTFGHTMHEVQPWCQVCINDSACTKFKFKRKKIILVWNSDARIWKMNENSGPKWKIQVVLVQNWKWILFNSQLICQIKTKPYKHLNCNFLIT